MMKLTDYFQLSLEERIAREAALPKAKPTTDKPYTLEDYYAIGDCSSFLEQLRAYQLADVLGKYKLF